MSNIIQVAENAKEIMRSQDVYCHICAEKQYAPFDKLYVSAYHTCVMCDSIANIEERQENIFRIIEGS